MRKAVLPILFVLVGCGAPPMTGVPVGDVVRVEAEVYWLGEVVDTATSDDPDAIRAVLEAVRSSDTPPAHTCSMAGRLTLTRRSGEPVQIFFLPGHDEQFYEYYDKRRTYRVDRAPFVTALRRVGLKRVPLDCGKPPPTDGAADGL